MKLLITGAWKPAEKDLLFLENAGYDLFFHQNEKEDLPNEFFDVDGIICNGLFLYNDINSFRRLKFVQLTSAGMDRVPLEYFIQKGIKVFNAAGVYSIPIAEFVISSVLDLYKKKHIFFDNQKMHVWEKQRDLIELSGKSVCIVGCGNIGKECAKKFKAFDCYVFGVDVVKISSILFDAVFHINELQSVVTNADIVVFTLPLTSETRHIVNGSLLLKMKKTAILVNVSRGGIVDMHDLIEALDSKTIGGAVLDVFENEPLEESSAFWDMSNVVVSPHNSFVGDGNANRLSKLIKENLANLI